MSDTFKYEVDVQCKTRGSIALCHVICRLHRIIGKDRAWRWSRAVIYRLARMRINGGPWLRMEQRR